jgi:hypothetical protein
VASRNASISITLNAASFQAGLRKMGSSVKSISSQMGTALKTGMGRGIAATRKSLASMGAGMKNLLSKIGGLASAATVGLLVRDAVKMNHQYRNIAFNVNKIKGNAIKWQEVQKLVEASAEATGQDIGEMANAFDTVFGATGELEFTKKAIHAIGVVATATGESVTDVARAAELITRKFDVSGDELAEGLVRFIEKTGVGGKGLDELSRKFGTMADSAQAVGFKGQQGISDLLGLINTLDAKVENVDAGLKGVFEALKDGTSMMKSFGLEMEKAKTGFEFDPGSGAIDKIRQILSAQSEQVRKSATELIFTGPARLVFDELAKTYTLAKDAALADKATIEDATSAGLAAFDKRLEDAGKSIMTFDDFLEEASKRTEEDVTVQLRIAINRMKKAFAQPEMIAAIESLAKHLPEMAKGLVDMIEFIREKPLQAAAIGVGAHAAVSGTAALGGMGLAAAGGRVAAAGRGATMAASAALAAKGIAAGVAGSIAAVVATVLAGVGIGALIGAAIDKLVFQKVREEGTKERVRQVASTEEALGAAVTAGGKGKTVAQKRAIVNVLKAQRSIVESRDIGVLEQTFSGVGGAFAGTKSAEEQKAEEIANLLEAQKKLEESIRLVERANRMQAEAAERAAKAQDKATAARGPAPIPEAEPGANPPGSR